MALFGSKEMRDYAKTLDARDESWNAAIDAAIEKVLKVADGSLSCEDIADELKALKRG